MVGDYEKWEYSAEQNFVKLDNSTISLARNCIQFVASGNPNTKFVSHNSIAQYMAEFRNPEVNKTPLNT